MQADYDSGETIYSMMGYETVAIHTINLDTSSDDDGGAIDNDRDDDDFTEFEIDSDADRENDRRNEEEQADKSDSGDDSDVQVSTLCQVVPFQLAPLSNSDHAG